MRERNGWIDDGTILHASEGRLCPNCGSADFRETLSLEFCPSCGLECDYWGAGANDIYNSISHADHEVEHEEED